MKRIIRSGNVIEEFYVWKRDVKETRAERRRGASDMRKVAANLKVAQKRLTRVLNENYAEGDLLITLKYRDDALEGKDRAALYHDRELFLRRIRRDLAHMGIEYRTVAVLGVRSSKTGEPARPHHHIVLPRMDYERLRARWEHGSVDYRLLRDDDTYAWLAEYLLKNAPDDIPDAKKYTISRGMRKPQCDEVIARGAGPIVPPSGAKVLHRGEYDRHRAVDYVVYLAPDAKKRVRTPASEVRTAAKKSASKQRPQKTSKQNRAAGGGAGAD
ncbi:MAG: hypothetical protein EOM69_09000 [Clostridia bacterium]|nr:hypothetical protein [Clostridia bacterium]